MRMRVAAVLILALAATGMARTQEGRLPVPSALEKELAGKASDVTEVTLSKQMLGFAAKFMDKDDKDDQEAKKLIQNLDGVYVRTYEFDHEGEVTPERVEQLRSYYLGGSGEWTPMVHEHETKNHSTTDVLMKMVKGEPRGLFVFDAEPKELTIVMILGPIKPEDLSKLHGLSGLGSLGNVYKGDKGAKTIPGK
jgi:hypothetical protein